MYIEQSAFVSASPISPIYNAFVYLYHNFLQDCNAYSMFCLSKAGFLS